MFAKEHETQVELNQVTLHREEAMQVCFILDGSEICPVIEDILCVYFDSGVLTLRPNCCNDESITYRYRFDEAMSLYYVLKNRKYTQVTLICHPWGIDLETFYED